MPQGVWKSEPAAMSSTMRANMWEVAGWGGEGGSEAGDDGADGEDGGGSISGHGAGIFQGVIAVTVDN